MGTTINPNAAYDSNRINNAANRSGLLNTTAIQIEASDDGETLKSTFSQYEEYESYRMALIPKEASSSRIWDSQAGQPFGGRELAFELQQAKQQNNEGADGLWMNMMETEGMDVFINNKWNMNRIDVIAGIFTAGHQGTSGVSSPKWKY